MPVRLTFDRLATGLLFLAIFATACVMPAQNDTWWHLRAGQLILAKGGLLGTDPFTYTAAGHAWTTAVMLACSPLFLEPMLRIIAPLIGG